MFVPCFWGSKISKAMHGYQPNLESQKGIFLCSDYDGEISGRDLRGTEAYLFLKSMLGGKR